MLQNIKKGISLGLLSWIISFFLGSIVMITIGQDRIGVSMIILGPIVIIFLARWYFKTVNPSMAEGLKLGILWAVMSVVLDVAILVYGFKNGWGFYSTWTIWVGYLEIIIVPMIVGKIMEKKISAT